MIHARTSRVMHACLRGLRSGLSAASRLPGPLSRLPCPVPGLLNPVSRGPMTPSAVAANTVHWRTPSVCGACLEHPEKKPCFNVDNLIIDFGTHCHGKMIRSFLYAHHWPREPSVTGLWMSLNSPYLQILTEKYAFSGDRILAFERHKRTGERKLIGVLCASKTFPWVADELEEWAHFTYAKADRQRLYFQAHCLKSPRLFERYKTDYIYDIEVLCTASEVMRQGVATALLKRALANATELHHPLTQIVCYSTYAARACEKLGMKKEWSMKYADFTDLLGGRAFYPRDPHDEVSIYVKKYAEIDAYGPCKPPW